MHQFYIILIWFGLNWLFLVSRGRQHQSSGEMWPFLYSASFSVGTSVCPKQRASVAEIGCSSDIEHRIQAICLLCCSTFNFTHPASRLSYASCPCTLLQPFLSFICIWNTYSLWSLFNVLYINTFTSPYAPPISYSVHSACFAALALRRCFSCMIYCPLRLLPALWSSIRHSPHSSPDKTKRVNVLPCNITMQFAEVVEDCLRH